jgi:glycosyltransferase involved in cell wall biosynthesis
MTKVKVLVLYDYFDPAYKAGGPIRSIVNLVKLLEEQFDFYVLATNQDHDGTFLTVKADDWITYGKNGHVHYLSPGKRTYSNLRQIILKLQPDTVYINGIYSLLFTVYPLWVLRNNKKCRIIIAPRGMLQKGALAIKSAKKRLYLAMLKRLVSMNQILWHVTNEHEANDLKSELAWPKYLQLGNIPFYNVEFALEKGQKHQPVKFGTIALISPMKNIHLVIESMKLINQPLQYTLFGPVKDQEYWQNCQKLIKELPAHISFSYKGDLAPAETAAAVAAFDYYIQPSVSENFGHSIFEAFNAGVPVIISDKTPWKNLRTQEAGWDVNLSDPLALQLAIEEALSLDEEHYQRFIEGARKIAEKYMNDHDLVNLYCHMLQGEIK